MKKFLKIFGIIILIVLATPVVAMLLFKGKIVERGKKEVNKMLNATVNFDNDISLHLFRSFPDLSLGVNNLQIVGKDSFANDTLIFAKEIDITVDIMSIIKGDKFEIKEITVDNPNVHVIVLPSGRANYDIMKPDSAQVDSTGAADTTSSFKMGLQKFELKNANIIYDDMQGAMYAGIKGMNHELSGDFTADETDLKTKTSIEEITFRYDGIPYLNKAKATLDAPIHADLKNFKFTFKENALDLNALKLTYDGWFAMPGDDMDMDIKFAAQKSSFKNFFSLIPGVYTKDFESMKVDGNLEFSGYVKGVYSDAKQTIPGFDLKLKVDNGSFQYASLPQSMKQIFLDLHVNNPDGNMDHTVVDLKKLTFNMAGDPFSARLLLKTPMSDPWMDLNAKGKLNLANVKSFIPLDGAALDGVIDADVNATGNYSTIEKENYDKFKASGYISAQNILYKSDSLPYDVKVPAARLDFTPQRVDLPQCQVNIGKSDITLKGGLENFFAYFFSDGILKGHLDVNSNYLNLNTLMGSTSPEKETPSPADTVAMEAFAVPENLDFQMRVNMVRVIYDNLELKNTVGGLGIAGNRVALEGVHAELFDGKIAIKGSYATPDPRKPKVAMDLSVNSMDIKKMSEYFTIVKQYAPIAGYMTGKLSTGLNLNMSLNKDMSPDLNSINSQGQFEIPNTKIVGLPALNAIADQLKIERIKTLALNKILMTFMIKDGRMYNSDPVKFAADKITGNIEKDGSTGLDQTIDYKLKFNLPAEWFGPASSVLSNMMKEVGKTSSALKPGEKLDVTVLVGGTFMKPTIKTSLKDIAKSLQDDLKDAAKDKAKEIVDDAKKKADEAAQKAIDEAKAAGEKLIAEAEKQAQRIRDEGEKAAKAIEDEANRQGQKLIKDAGNNPLKKIAAEKAAKELNRKAKENADKVRQEANNKATGVINDAKAKADKLVKDAEAKKNQTLK